MITGVLQSNKILNGKEKQQSPDNTDNNKHQANNQFDVVSSMKKKKV